MAKVCLLLLLLLLCLLSVCSWDSQLFFFCELFPDLLCFTRHLAGLSVQYSAPGLFSSGYFGRFSQPELFTPPPSSPPSLEVSDICSELRTWSRRRTQDGRHHCCSWQLQPVPAGHSALRGGDSVTASSPGAFKLKVCLWLLL